MRLVRNHWRKGDIQLSIKLQPKLRRYTIELFGMMFAVVLNLQINRCAAAHSWALEPLRLVHPETSPKDNRRPTSEDRLWNLANSKSAEQHRILPHNTGSEHKIDTLFFLPSDSLCNEQTWPRTLRKVNCRTKNSRCKCLWQLKHGLLTAWVHSFCIRFGTQSCAGDKIDSHFCLSAKPHRVTRDRRSETARPATDARQSLYLDNILTVVQNILFFREKMCAFRLWQTVCPHKTVPQWLHSAHDQTIGIARWKIKTQHNDYPSQFSPHFYEVALLSRPLCQRIICQRKDKNSLNDADNTNVQSIPVDRETDTRCSSNGVMIFHRQLHTHAMIRDPPTPGETFSTERSENRFFVRAPDGVNVEVPFSEWNMRTIVAKLKPIVSRSCCSAPGRFCTPVDTCRRTRVVNFHHLKLTASIRVQIAPFPWHFCTKGMGVTWKLMIYEGLETQQTKAMLGFDL